MSREQVSRDYPLPLSESRRRIKQAFTQQAQLTEENDILRAVHYGRYKVTQDG